MKQLLILLMIFVAACEIDKKAPILPSPTPTPAEEPSTHKTRLRLYADNTHTEKEAVDVPLAEEKMNDTLQTKCFVDYMTGVGLIETGGRTPQEVVDHLQGLDMDITTSMYYSSTNSVGYAYYGKPTIYANRRYFDGYGICSKASLFLHEIAHVVWYTHKDMTNRWYTVPYAINTAFSKCCR